MEPSEAQRRFLGPELASQFISNFDPVEQSDDSLSDSSFENDVVLSNNCVSDAQQQWDENMKQLETAIFFVLFPVIGRLIGRRFAQKCWRRFVNYRWALATGQVAEK